MSSEREWGIIEKMERSVERKNDGREREGEREGVQAESDRNEPLNNYYDSTSEPEQHAPSLYIRVFGARVSRGHEMPKIVKHGAHNFHKTYWRVQRVFILKNRLDFLREKKFSRLHSRFRNVQQTRSRIWKFLKAFGTSSTAREINSILHYFIYQKLSINILKKRFKKSAILRWQPPLKFFVKKNKNTTTRVTTLIPKDTADSH